MNDDANPQNRPWSRAWRDAAAIVWPAFITAAAASVVVFGLFDPADLSEIAAIALPGGRMGGYAAGFFFLWLVCIVAAALAVFMLRSYHRPGS